MRVYFLIDRVFFKVRPIIQEINGMFDYIAIISSLQMVNNQFYKNNKYNIIELYLQNNAFEKNDQNDN